MKKMYDVTMTINENIVVYKDKVEKKPVFTVASSKKAGDSTNETYVKFNVHTGTHMDFARHVQDDGVTSKGFDVTTFLRTARVLDLTNVTGEIKPEHLEKFNIAAGETIFLKTKNSDEDYFNVEFIFVGYDAAKYLAAKKVFAVGLDALGIERDQPGHPTHHTLINHNVWIIEGLRLKEVPEGTYELIALPLKLDDVDGTPLTVVLKEM
ncbi:MAG TPA: cyclase family protein [Bacilli bacterium]|nr:cyclase family protein [Bacilli bacterium]